MIDIADQYRIIATGAGWIDRSTRGRVRFDGADRASFLQALLSNEVAALAAGAGTYALYLTPQGRLIADLHVFVRPDGLVVDVPVQKAATLAAMFDGLIFAEDVRVSDQSGALRQISVVGAGAARVISQALHVVEDDLRRLPVWSQCSITGGFVARTDDADEGSWDVVVEKDAADPVVAALQDAGAIAMSPELANAIRIDAGRPAFGVDMTEETIPLEAGLLERAISQTKGCYVGQEVIIRVLHRGGGRVAKRLVRIVCDDEGGEVPAVGAVVSADDREVGRVTSSARSPRTGRNKALAYVHRDAAEAGRRLTLMWSAGNAVGSLLRSDGVIEGFAG